MRIEVGLAENAPSRFQKWVACSAPPSLHALLLSGVITAVVGLNSVFLLGLVSAVLVVVVAVFSAIFIAAWIVLAAIIPKDPVERAKVQILYFRFREPA